MLKITDAMLRGLASHKQEEYIGKLLEFVRSQAPPLFDHLSDAEASARIRAAIESAKTLGDISDSGLAKYAALSMLCGLEFTQSQDVLGFLSTPGRSLDVKIEWLISRVATQLKDLRFI